MNIRITYLYRDASNYKRWEDVVVVNPSGLPAVTVRGLLAEACRCWELFGDQIHFMPELVGLKTCYFTDAGYAASDDDLELHEVHEVTETEAPTTDPRTIETLIKALRDVGGVASARTAGYTAGATSVPKDR